MHKLTHTLPRLCLRANLPAGFGDSEHPFHLTFTGQIINMTVHLAFNTLTSFKQLTYQNMTLFWTEIPKTNLKKDIFEFHERCEFHPCLCAHSLIKWLYCIYCKQTHLHSKNTQETTALKNPNGQKWKTHKHACKHLIISVFIYLFIFYLCWLSLVLTSLKNQCAKWDS